MINQKIKVKGMHCASCSVMIEKELKKSEGVQSAEVNYATESAKISYDESKTNPHQLSKEIEKLGYSLLIPEDHSKNHGASAKEMGMTEDEHKAHLGLNQSKEEKQKELEIIKSKADFALPISLLIFGIMMWEILARTTSFMPNLPIPMEVTNIIGLTLSTVMLFWVGKQFIDGVVRFARYRVANMDTLIGIGTLSAYIYSAVITLFPFVRTYFGLPPYTYFDVTIVVIGFVILGKYLESKSKAKTGDAIEKLLGLQAKTALLYENGTEKEVSIENVKIGDIIIIKPGMKIPVDGVITSGNSFINESMVTGEPMPKKVKEGDVVIGGTINQSGSFQFKAKKVGKDTMLAEIIRMVEDAQGSKAPIQALADKISSIFVPTVLALAVTALALWLSIGSVYLGFSEALSYGILSFVGILVIACPCALGLATPTAIIVGVGKGAREGILIKDASALEKLHKVNTVVLDKTGTITEGKPSLVHVENLSSQKEEEVISLLASLENKSEHPIAHAIVKYSKDKSIEIKEVENFENIEGKGIKGKISGTTYFAGNLALVNDLKINLDTTKILKHAEEGKTPIILMTEHQVLGFFMVADKIKDTAKEAVTNLHKLGIKVVMLTGDEEKTARYIANLAGIDEVVAHVLPHDKLAKIKELQAQGRIVAMAGDGVNDAPALAQADVGIAMATGTDVAIESAGITLLSGDISKLVKAIRLSKITMRGIKQNLFWAFFYNVLGIPLAGGLFYPIFGWLLNPVFAGLAMAMSSVSVVGNSLRIKSKKL